MIAVYDLTVGHLFECETEDGAADIENAIRLLGHEAVVWRQP